MVLVDTNVVAALWVQSDRTDRARRLLGRNSDWRTEAFALIEFASVMSTSVRNGLEAEFEALLRLGEAERFLGPGVVLASHRSSLSAAVAHGVAVYDARFLVVASELDVRLVTEDLKLRRAVPELTPSLDQALAA